jgi:hypothetical protein
VTKQPVSVICTDNDGCVCEHKLFTGKNNVKRAERFFIKRAKELNLDFDKAHQQDALDEGWYKHNGMHVCIGEPEIKRG